MVLGRGAVLRPSLKYKLNVNISTKLDLVGAHDELDMVLLSNNCIEAKGCTVENSKLYEDNNSAILMENNVRSPSSKKTKHIKLRYFLLGIRFFKVTWSRYTFQHSKCGHMC